MHLTKRGPVLHAARLGLLRHREWGHPAGAGAAPAHGSARAMPCACSWAQGSPPPSHSPEQCRGLVVSGQPHDRSLQVMPGPTQVSLGTGKGLSRPS